MEFMLYSVQKFVFGSAIAEGDWIYINGVNSSFQKIDVTTGKVVRLKAGSGLQLIKC